DREHRAASVLDGRGAVLMKVAGSGQVVAPWEQSLEPLQERRIDCESIGERSVLRAGLFDNDPPIAFDNVSADFSDVCGDERLNRLGSRKNAVARLADADRTERVGHARPPERRLRTLGA